MLIVQHRELPRRHYCQFDLVAGDPPNEDFDIALVEQPMTRRIGVHVGFKFDLNGMTGFASDDVHKPTFITRCRDSWFGADDMKL